MSHVRHESGEAHFASLSQVLDRRVSEMSESDWMAYMTISFKSPLLCQGHLGTDLPLKQYKLNVYPLVPVAILSIHYFLSYHPMSAEKRTIIHRIAKLATVNLDT